MELLVAMTAIAGILASGCRRNEERAASAPGTASAMTGPSGDADRAGAGRITLEADARVRIGLALAPAFATRSEGEREAYGRVLDVVPLAEQLATRESARAALAQTRREYERVLALHRSDQNTSTREVEAAELALRRAESDLTLAQERLHAGWGDALAGRADLPALVHRLADGSAALGRVEIPAGEPARGAPTLEGLSLATAPANLVRAMLLAPAPSTDPLTQGQGFLVLIEPGPPPPGTALVARLRFASEARAGVYVPRSAVVWKDGRPYVWVESGGHVFERRAVDLGAGQGAGWLALGIEPGARLVISGAQELLSEELLAATGSR